jgi:peptidoglycan/xylan/chitin deacetylase (PgdA/CDA1 family)
MIRTWIKTRAAHVACRTGLDRVVGSLSGARRTPLIVGYHRVVEDFASSAQTSIPSLLVSRAMLERHLDWLGRRYRFVDLDELGALLESGRAFDNIARPVAAITFDDGYRDFYDLALPTLRKKGVPAALFVCTDLVGTARAQIHDRLYFLLGRRRGHAPLTVGMPLPAIAGMNPYQAMRALRETVPWYGLQRVIRALESEDSMPEHAFSPSITWEELDRIRRAGIVVGSHTRTHIVMTNETRNRVIDEAAGSRQELERRLGAPVRHFAYPSGIYNAASVSAVAAAGYRFGYTTCAHRSSEHPLLTVPRTLWWEGSGLDSNRALSESIMSCQVNGAFELVAGCRQNHAFAPGRLEANADL